MIEFYKLVHCKCYANQDCNYCLGSGYSLEMQHLPSQIETGIIMSDSNINAKKEFQINEETFLSANQNILPEKINVAIFKSKNFKSQVDLLCIPLYTDFGTVDYAIGTFINSILERIHFTIDYNHFKTKNFSIVFKVKNKSDFILGDRFFDRQDFKSKKIIVRYCVSYFKNFYWNS